MAERIGMRMRLTVRVGEVDTEFRLGAKSEAAPKKVYVQVRLYRQLILRRNGVVAIASPLHGEGREFK
jgi:hypothetical protein